MYPNITYAAIFLISLLLMVQLTMLVIIKKENEPIKKGSFIATGFLFLSLMTSIATSPKGITVLSNFI